MLFWIVAGALAAVVALILVRPLLAPARTAPLASDREVYRDQMAELARDLDRGLLAPEDAERARVEVARRLLAADRAGPARLGEAPPGATGAVVAGGAVVVVLGSLGLYAALGAPGTADAPRAARLLAAEEARAARPSQQEAEAAARPLLAQAEADPAPDLAPLVEQLRARVPTEPGNLEGWALLASVEASLGRYAAAARAQERVLAIRGEAAVAEDRVLLADLLVAAADGMVTEAAEVALGPLAQADPTQPAVLYYLGLLEAEVGQPDRAFGLWRKLVEDGAPGPHRDLALTQIAGVAAAAGVDWTAPQEAPAQDALRAPGEEAAMIQGMVDSLRARLDAEGGPPEDWARLATSLSVLGDREGAADALARGRAAHEGDEAQAVLADAARRAGLE